MPKIVETQADIVQRPLVRPPEILEIVGSYDLQPFRMVSDARARRVARDLRDLLKSEGVVVGLTRAQALTAQIYGYSTWRELIADLGEDFSPDDCQEDDLEVAARYQRAARALGTAVTSIGTVQRILMALRPTDRAVLTEHRAALVALANPDAFHPVRLRRLVDESELVGAALDEIDRDPVDACGEADLLERAGLAGLAVIEAAVADDDLTLLPYDAYAVIQRRMLPLYAAATRVATGAFALIDAEAVALALAERPVPDLLGPTDHYVHFGAARFPSPYPGLCIEGCYVRTCPDGDVVVSAVVSPPSFGTAPEAYLEDFETGAMLLAHCRGHTMRLVDIIDGSLSVALAPYADIRAIGAYDAQGRPPFTAGLDGLWRTYLRPAAAAAVNAVATLRETPFAERVIGVTVSPDHPVARRLGKARTDQQWQAALQALREETDGSAVLMLGQTPTSAETGYVPDALPDAPAFWPTVHAETWLGFFLGGGTPDYDFSESPELTYDYARFVAPDRARFQALPPRLRDRVLEAARAYAEALLVTEDGPGLVELADDMLALDTPEAARFLALKAVALIEERSFPEAERAIAALGSTEPAAAGWLDVRLAESRGDAEAGRRLRLAYEADPALVAALMHGFEGEGDAVSSEPLAQDPIRRSVQILSPALVEIQRAIAALKRDLRHAPRGSHARH